MLIEKLHLQNFLSFANTTFQIGDTGLLLISGRNGAGKSSISSKAITWALFGETPGGVKSDDVVSIAAPKAETKVQVWFSVQGRPWKIERTRNPVRLTVTNLEDGQEKSFRNPKETQDFIHSLIGRDLNAFMASDYFGQDSRRRFLTQTPGVQQGIVEEILRIEQRVEPLIQEARSRADSLGKQREELQSRLQNIEGSKAELERQRVGLQSQQTAAEHGIQLAERQPAPVLRTVPEVGEPPQLVKVPAPELIADPPEPEEVDLTEIYALVASLEEQREKTSDDVRDLDRGVEEALANERLASDAVSACRSAIERLLPQVREIQDSSCPECGQTVDQEKTDALKAQVAKVQGEITNLRGHLSEFEESQRGWLRVLAERKECRTRTSAFLGEAEKELQGLRSQIKQATQAREVYERARKDAQVQRERAQAAYEAQKAEAETRYRAALEIYEQKRSGIEDERRKAEAEYAAAIQARESALTQAKLRLQIIEESLAALELSFGEYVEQTTQLTEEIAEVERSIGKMHFWVDAFRHSFKRFMLEQSLPFLNDRVAYHLSLLGNPQLEVEFSTTKVLKSGDERGAFSVRTCTHQGGQAYGSLSGGERQIASFAVGLALSELADAQSGSSSEFLILDEPFTELDPTNCSNVIHYISTELVKRKRSVLLISNDPNLRQLVANRVEVTKDATGTSHLTAE